MRQPVVAGAIVAFTMLAAPASAQAATAGTLRVNHVITNYGGNVVIGRTYDVSTDFHTAKLMQNGVTITLVDVKPSVSSQIYATYLDRSTRKPVYKVAVRSPLSCGPGSRW